MRNKNNKHLGIEVDPELHYKLRYIAKYEGRRSANKEIEQYLKKRVAEYESEFGTIEIENN